MAADARLLYRALLIRDVGGDLPLEEFGPEELVSERHTRTSLCVCVCVCVCVCARARARACVCFSVLLISSSQSLRTDHTQQTNGIRTGRRCR
jgi:hypothetical protein